MSWSVSRVKYKQIKVVIICHLNNSELSSTAVLILTSYLATDSSVRSVPTAELVLNVVRVLQVVKAGHAFADLSTAPINSL